MKKVLLALLTLVLLCGAVFAAQTYTVTARVVSGSGAIQAELQPVDFTIPSGATGTVTAFYATNPKTGWESKTLGKNIYCVTQGRGSMETATLSTSFLQGPTAFTWAGTREPTANLPTRCNSTRVLTISS